MKKTFYKTIIMAAMIKAVFNICMWVNEPQYDLIKNPVDNYWNYCRVVDKCDEDITWRIFECKVDELALANELDKYEECGLPHIENWMEKFKD